MIIKQCNCWVYGQEGHILRLDLRNRPDKLLEERQWEGRVTSYWEKVFQKRGQHVSRPGDMVKHGYLRSWKFLPGQTAAMQENKFHL